MVGGGGGEEKGRAMGLICWVKKKWVRMRRKFMLNVVNQAGKCVLTAPSRLGAGHKTPRDSHDR